MLLLIAPAVCSRAASMTARTSPKRLGERETARTDVWRVAFNLCNSGSLVLAQHVDEQAQ